MSIHARTGSVMSFVDNKVHVKVKYRNSAQAGDEFSDARHQFIIAYQRGSKRLNPKIPRRLLPKHDEVDSKDASTDIYWV